MQIEVQDLPDYKKTLSIEVDYQEIKEKLEETYQKLSQEAFVPGFRKGKVPLTILKMRLGKEIKEQVKQEVVEENYRKAIQEKGLNPISPPKIEDIELEEGKPLKFKATIEAIPPIQLGTYQGVEVEKEKIEVLDEDVEAIIQQKREEEAQLIPVKDRPSLKGDLLTVDYEVEVDNKVIRRMREQKLILGRSPLPKELEKGLIGVKKGEVKKIKITPKGEEKEALYHFTILDLQERRLVVVNDDFAQRIGDFATLTDLRKRIREELEALAKAREEQILRNKILDKILANSQVEIPPSMVKKLASYYRVSVQGLKESESNKLAEEQIKSELLLEEIAHKENLKVSEEELTKRRREVVAGGSKEEKQKWLDEENKENLLTELRREKVMNFLREQAKIKEKKKRHILTPEEARKLDSQKSKWGRKSGQIITPGGQ